MNKNLPISSLIWCLAADFVWSESNAYARELLAFTQLFSCVSSLPYVALFAITTCGLSCFFSTVSTPCSYHTFRNRCLRSVCQQSNSRSGVTPTYKFTKSQNIDPFVKRHPSLDATRTGADCCFLVTVTVSVVLLNLLCFLKCATRMWRHSKLREMFVAPDIFSWRPATRHCAIDWAN